MRGFGKWLVCVMQKSDDCMKIIADSGSTKTDWLIWSSENDSRLITSAGINPFFKDSATILEELREAFAGVNADEVSEVFFYGAGVIAGKTDNVVSRALEQFFANAGVEVNDDMLGAARALLQHQGGIACILGTGANSCLYDGKGIVDKVPTLGFILGDEGSGAYFGKLFVNRYFKRALPSDLHAAVESELALQWPDVLQAVYRGDTPNRYLAAFTRFLSRHKEHSWVEAFMVAGFKDFLQRNVLKYSNAEQLEVSFVGSVAFYFSEFLGRAAEELSLKIGTISAKPIEGLKVYHS